MFLDRRMSAREVIPYWIAQFVGAVLGALALLLMTSSDDVAKAATVPGSAASAPRSSPSCSCSAIFMIVILAVTKSKANASTAFVAIALTLLAIHFALVPFSGSSVNPARSFGTALIGNRWTDFWIYILAPPIGAILGWMIYAVVVKGDTNLRDDFDSMRKDVGTHGRQRRRRELGLLGEGRSGGPLQDRLDPLGLAAHVVLGGGGRAAGFGHGQRRGAPQAVLDRRPRQRVDEDAAPPAGRTPAGRRRSSRRPSGRRPSPRGAPGRTARRGSGRRRRARRRGGPGSRRAGTAGDLDPRPPLELRPAAGRRRRT